MKKIHRLPQSLVAKIAAGEVIERPAFAVKELIENAIDAKASVIEIQIEESGLRRITVIDNGEGMSKEDLEICFLPHTTSKLNPTDDLSGIKTLGFRGEALSSLAAVSHMTLITRHQKDIGGRIIQIRGGIVEDSSPIGSPIGTIITAEGLFYSVPARKKFLKSAQTEFRHITDIVTRYALSNPEIHFILKHNKKSVLELPDKNSFSDRITSILGTTALESLLPLHYEDNHLIISGFIGTPQTASRQNQKQFLFVNKRYITDKMISLAIKEAYGSLLPASFSPVYLLTLSLPPEMVDVNVHPRKEQIAFLNKKQIFDSVKSAISQTLKENNISFSLAKFKQETSVKTGETTSFSARVLKNAVLHPEKDTVATILPTSPIIQIADTYLVAETTSGIILFDQHAVHERILFHQFLTIFKNAKEENKHYELPQTLLVELSLSEAQTYAEFEQVFRDIGFLGKLLATRLEVIEIPELFKGRNNEKIIRDMLADLMEDTGLKEVDIRSERMLKFLSCRAAIKAGDRLTNEQIRVLRNDFEQTPENVTCPHGRPTHIMITITDLEKMFRR